MYDKYDKYREKQMTGIYAAVNNKKKLLYVSYFYLISI